MEPALPNKTVIIVQPFDLRNGRLVPGEAERMRCRESAVIAARGLSQRRAGVVVYTLEGNPAADDWRAGEIVAKYGETPNCDGEA